MRKTLEKWWAKFHDLRDLLHAATITNGAIDPDPLMKAREILAKILHDGAESLTVFRIMYDDNRFYRIVDDMESVQNVFQLLSNDGEGFDVLTNKDQTYSELRQNGKRVFYAAKCMVETQN